MMFRKGHFGIFLLASSQSAQYDLSINIYEMLTAQDAKTQHSDLLPVGCHSPARQCRQAHVFALAALRQTRPGEPWLCSG